MSDASKAVFLSYAREDTAAVQRMAEALRAAGVEVWFDQNELVGGDAWDAKIRNQIKTCALFVPVISAATQARREGYFRIEWKLAAQRTHAIADGTPFLVPVSIDATGEGEALVPAEFREVQWMRLANGEVNNAFCERVKTLLAPPTDAGRTRFIQRDDSAAQPAAAPSAPAPTKKKNPPWLTALIVGVPLVVGLVLAWRLMQRSSNESAISGRAPAVATSAGSQTKAQQLIAQAQLLYEPWDVAPVDDLKLADRLLKEATELEPLNADGWSSLAINSHAQHVFGFDRSDARKELLRTSAERAVKLAPDSRLAKLALALRLRVASPRSEEAFVLLRELAARPDADKLTLRQFGSALRDRGEIDEAMKHYDRAAALPGSDPVAYHLRGFIFEIRGQLDQAEAAFDHALALRPDFGAAAMEKIDLMLSNRGDLEGAKEVVQRMPERMLDDDRVAALAVAVWYFAHDPDRAAAALQHITKDFVDSGAFPAPKGLFAGLIDHVAGRDAAATAQWRGALRLVDERLAQNPAGSKELASKAYLHALLGENARAEEALHVYEQLLRQPSGRASAGTWRIYAALGREDAVADFVAEQQGRFGVAERPDVHGRVAAFFIDPALDSFRSRPRFQPLAAEAERLRAVAKRSSAAASAPKLKEAAAPVAKADDKSIAVLAFANFGGDKENEYFSDGITEELLNVLAKVPGLRVAARTSAFYFKDKNVPIPEIAQKLNVAYVVEGSVQKSGTRVKITAQLIKAADGFHVWSDTFTRELKDVFAMQDEIAGLIAKQLQLTLGDAPRVAKTVNPEAHRLVLEGRFFWNQRSEEGFARAEADFKRALEIDPDFAEAHAGLAGVFTMRSWYRIMAGNATPAEGDVARAKEEVRRAKALNPQLAEPSASLGIVLMNELKFEESERQFAEAITLDPNDTIVRHWHSNLLAAEGRLDEAVNEIARSLSLDPLYSNALWAKAYYFGHAGRTQEALDATERALALRPGHPTILSERALALWKLGRRDDAIASARGVGRDLTAQPRWLADPHAIYVLRLAGLQAEAEAYAERALANVPKDDYRYGTTLVALGRGKEALQYLRTLNSTALISVYWNPMWDSLREDAQFQQWLVTIGCAEQYKLARETQARMLKEQAGRK